jgi:hypothetical protein
MLGSWGGLEHEWGARNGTLIHGGLDHEGATEGSWKWLPLKTTHHSGPERDCREMPKISS